MASLFDHSISRHFFRGYIEIGQRRRAYPYAYIDAPAPFCEGLTEDGCHLQWQEVPTLEGPPVFQCVAYCPWQ